MPEIARGEVEALERCALAAWPALATRDCQGWALRSADGYTKRANSANPLVPNGDFGLLRREAEAHYAALGLRAIFRLSPLAPPGADAALAAAGYALVEPSLVMTAPLDHAAAETEVAISDRADDAWFRGFAEATGEPAGAAALHAALHTRIGPRHAAARIERGGEPVAFGLAVLDAGRLGLFDIAVAPRHRGEGLGGAISRALLGWGRGHGAASAYLQVVEANPPARALYVRLGFAPAYGYHYRVSSGQP